MRSLLTIAALVMLAAPAAAGPRTRPARAATPATAASSATPTASTTAAAATAPAAAATPTASASSSCREVVNGRGRTRKVCRIEKDIIVSTDAPRPQVLIVDAGGRKVVGKPKNADRLADAPRQLP